MPTERFSRSITYDDLSPRFAATTAVAASPAAAAETIIASLALPGAGTLASGIFLMGWAAYTLGTAAASARLRIRQTNASGTVVADTDAQTGGHNTAGQKVSDDVNGFDTAPSLPGQVYVLTLTVASASAASTVSSVFLAAIIV